MEENNDIIINSLCFDTDFDDVGWDPIVVDDSDSEEAYKYGY